VIEDRQLCVERTTSPLQVTIARVNDHESYESPQFGKPDGQREREVRNETRQRDRR